MGGGKVGGRGERGEHTHMHVFVTTDVCEFTHC